MPTLRHFQEWFKSDGRFRLVVFAGNVLSSTQKERLDAFCAELAASEFLAPHIHKDIGILTCHSAKRTETELLRDFPDVLHPFDDKFGWDYNSVFVDDESFHEGHGEAYKQYGVDKERGCIVITRPDQYVGFIGELDGGGVKGVEAFFEGIFVS